LLACGVIGPALFVAAFLAQGAVRPYYDPLRHPVSSLAIGDMGWVQCANFVVAGALLLGAIAFDRWLGQRVARMETSRGERRVV